MATIAIFTYEPWEKELYLSSLKDHNLLFFDTILSHETLPKEAIDAEVISVFVDSFVTKEVIEAMPKLKLIVTRSTGFDHIAIDVAKEHGIVVSSVPAYGANTVAEHAFGLLLALSKRIVDGYEQLRESGSYDPRTLRGFDLKGRTLGIVGTGRIGQHAIKIGNGFGMKVIGFDAFPDKALESVYGFVYASSLDDLLSRSDVISIHVPYLKETHHMINSTNIMNVKKGAVIINTSRGPVVETEALFSALESGHLRGAGLDVVEEEGFIKDEMHLLSEGALDNHNLKVALMNHKLIDMQNVIMTPHSAFNTQEALERILQTTIENITSYFSGTPQNNVIK